MDNSVTVPINWDKLCRHIAAKKLIPILGHEMYSFNSNGVDYTLESYYAEELLKRSGSTNSGVKTIAAAVDYLLRQGTGKGDIIESLSDIKTEGFDFTLLNDFLAIDQLFFYVNTAIYGSILTSKIKQLRGETVTESNFSIRENFKADITTLESLDHPFIFSIFGSITNSVSPALSGEEMLEFTTALIGKMSDEKFAPILDALKNKTLLFLGCSQPGWLIRFMFRILSNERIENWSDRPNGIIVVNNSCEERDREFDFLTSYKALAYLGNTADFIQELKTKWQEYIKINPPKEKRIFVSYSHKDKVAADLFVEKLRKITHTTCWYDTDSLWSGDNYDKEIAKHINAADLFIPLISGNSVSGEGSYVKKEWDMAHYKDVLRSLNKDNRKYILPVIIDNTDSGDSRINGCFPQLTVVRVAGGDADDQFINKVRQELELI